MDWDTAETYPTASRRVNTPAGGARRFVRRRKYPGFVVLNLETGYSSCSSPPRILTE